MCNFLSALIFGPKLELKFGRFYSDPLTTNSHTDLEVKLGLVDRHADPEWAKVEYTPGPEKGLADFDGYVFKIDETITPDWLSEDLIEEFKVYAKAKLADIIITSGTHDLIDTPKKAICGSARIGSVCGSARIGSVLDSANIGSVYGSAIVIITDGSPAFKLREGCSALVVDRRTNPQTIYGEFQAFMKPKRVKKEESNA